VVGAPLGCVDRQGISTNGSENTCPPGSDGSELDRLDFQAALIGPARALPGQDMKLLSYRHRGQGGALLPGISDPIHNVPTLNGVGSLLTGGVEGNPTG
jgi:hypothetical protein